SGGVVLAAVVLVIALAASTTVAVVQSTRLADQRDATASLQAQAAEDAATIEQLQQALEAATDAPDPADADPFADLFGDGGLEELLGEGGLEGLLGEDGLEGLLGGSALEATPDVAACTAGI